MNKSALGLICPKQPNTDMYNESTPDFYRWIPADSPTERRMAGITASQPCSVDGRASASTPERGLVFWYPVLSVQQCSLKLVSIFVVCPLGVSLDPGGVKAA